ncbi:isocitrate lyase/PEP mutase family protein [Alphaproteobacteria bacterium]|nr:isocitrate lyase/PEP mutase family protein [Alphaproteobacteria bacterium]
MNRELNKKFREILEEKKATLIPGAFNALSAKIIEDEGFKAIYLTGAGLTNAKLGLPDLAFISLKDLAEAVFSIRSISKLPIIVDADTGFGNVVNVNYTVKILEQAGANAIQIEDQVFPKKCGHFESKSVLDIDEAVMKIKTAVDSRIDKNFLIIARTDARNIFGFEEAINRANKFIEAGADVTFVESPKSIKEIEEIPKLIDRPQILNLVFGGKTPILSQKELENMNFGAILYANAPLQSAMKSIKETIKYIKTNGSINGWEENLISFDERQKIVSKDYYDDIENKFSLDSLKGE